MLEKKKFLKTPLGEALNEFSKEIDTPITLNIVGEFALILHEKRDKDMLTDIDYIGEDLSDKVKKIIERIGIKRNLGKYWINNEVIMSGTSLNELEMSTGKLHFDNSIQINNLTVNILNEKDILKMKLIAIDTATTALEAGEPFIREKDFEDIKVLMNANNMNINDIQKDYSHLLINNNTLKLINIYNTKGKESTKQAINIIRNQNLTKLENPNNRKPSKFITNLLNDLYEKKRRRK